MLGKIWAFCSKPANLALIIALGSAIAWFWGEVKPPSPPAENKSATAPIEAAPAQNAEAGNGGTAINARDNASVTIQQ